jgi:hypothetical protein
MHKLMRGVAAALICATFGMADSSPAAAAGRGVGFAGGGGAFHGAGEFHRFHGFRGFYRGIYPYSLFGYPNYSYGGYYPYSVYEDVEPDCDFVWVKRTAKHKVVRRGIWTCS